MATHPKTYETTVKVEIKTDDPELMDLIRAADAEPAGSAQQDILRGRVMQLLAEWHFTAAAEHEGYNHGHRDGLDEGAMPFLEGGRIRRAIHAWRS